MNTRIWRTGVLALALAAPLVAKAQEPRTAGDTPATAALKEQFRFDTPLTPAPKNEPIPSDVVQLEQIVVRQSKLMKQTMQMLDQKKSEEAAKAFTLIGGGRLWEGALAGFPSEAGLWKWDDLLKEGARFKDAQTMVKFDAVRIQW